ncbi:MAG: carbon-nitrogen hydrolase family protein, partial [Candidatus Hydrogenedentes bacterium]|nr:carbon-nitrogen hydrolase family protein [Candidatus Hydrogenedentota bacterium]
GALFSYNEKPSFGLLSFDTRARDPRVTYSIINIDNQTVHEHTLHRSELTFTPASPSPTQNRQLSTQNSSLRVAQMQGIPEKWGLDANMKVFLEQVEEAATQRADVFITPECWLDGYAAPDPASTPERLRTVAQPLEGSPYLEKVADAARRLQLWICFGFTSLEDGKIYNTCGLWDRAGKLHGAYHKTHLQTHDLQFSTGTALPVWPSEFGPLGMMICADRRWPETARTLRVQGAKLILNPTYGMHGEFNLQMMRVRAYENQCYIAFTHPQQSLLVGPGGDILTNVESDTPGLTTTQIDLANATDDNHLQDRRPDLYTPLLR